jgi:hypothetical protein
VTAQILLYELRTLPEYRTGEHMKSLNHMKAVFSEFLRYPYVRMSSLMYSRESYDSDSSDSDLHVSVIYLHRLYKVRVQSRRSNVQISVTYN